MSNGLQVVSLGEEVEVHHVHVSCKETGPSSGNSELQEM